MFRILLSALLFCGLATPSSAEPKSGLPETQTIRSTGNPVPQTGIRQAGAAAKGPCHIGVIPIAVDSFAVREISLDALFHFNPPVNVAEWALDDLIVSRVQVAVPDRAVRKISVSRQDAADEKPRLTDSDSETRGLVRRMSAGSKCERYVIVNKRSDGHVSGIGIEHQTHNQRVYLYTLLRIEVYDGRNFKLIKDAAALTEDGSQSARGMFRPIGGPYQALDVAAFPAEPRDAASNPVLRDGVRALLTASFDRTLPALLRR